MVRTMFKRFLACAMLLAWMLVAPGCGVKQSDYDAKVAETKAQADKAAQLQKDLDAVKTEMKQARRRDTEAKIKTLEQENATLKDRLKALEQDLVGLKTSAESAATQLGKDLAAAKTETTKAQQAKTAADAKIKTLEQENADLKKKSKPLDFLKKK